MIEKSLEELKEDFKNRPVIEYDLPKFIRNTEERIASYKSQLEEVSRDKVHFPPDDKNVIWFKAFLREEKSINQSFLKDLIKERTKEIIEENTYETQMKNRHL